MDNLIRPGAFFTSRSMNLQFIFIIVCCSGPVHLLHTLLRKNGYNVYVSAFNVKVVSLEEDTNDTIISVKSGLNVVDIPKTSLVPDKPGSSEYEMTLKKVYNFEHHHILRNRAFQTGISTSMFVFYRHCKACDSFL